MYRWVLSHLILFLKTFKFVLDTKHKSCYIIDTTKQGSTYKEEMKMTNTNKEVIERINLYWDEITNYMEENIREWTYYHYYCESNEKFLKEYFLRLIYEYGIDEANAFDILLWDEFNIDINDIVTFDEKEEVLIAYESTIN